MRKLKSVRCAAAVTLLIILTVSIAVFCIAAGGGTSGKTSRSDGKLTLDVSHISEGYLRAQAKASKKRMKLRVSKDENMVTYDLNSDGEYETIPLQYGNGSYVCTLYQNTSGSKYSQEGRIRLKVEMEDENAPFLCPNQYVNYDPEDEELLAAAASACGDAASAREKYDAICAFMRADFVYDYVRALSLPAGTLPEIDECLQTHMGTCQDLAALMVSLLRIEGVPAKLLIGYADANYHAWVSATVDGHEEQFDPTAEVHGLPKPASYTVERYY